MPPGRDIGYCLAMATTPPLYLRAVAPHPGHRLTSGTLVAAKPGARRPPLPDGQIGRVVGAGRADSLVLVELERDGTVIEADALDLVAANTLGLGSRDSLRLTT